MSLFDDLIGLAVEQGIPTLGKPRLDADLIQDNHVGASLIGLGGFILGQSVGGQVAGYYGLSLGAVVGAAIEAWTKAVVKGIGSIFN